MLDVRWGAGRCGRSFFLSQIALAFLYYTKYIRVDDEEWGRTELVKEGLMSAFGLFVVRVPPAAAGSRGATQARAAGVDHNIHGDALIRVGAAGVDSCCGGRSAHTP